MQDTQTELEKINLSLLANVLAHKAGVDVKEGKHFCTDGKTIWIPAGMVGTEDDAKLIRGGICHEAVGHVRHTDFEATAQAVSKLQHELANVLEDIRIERACWSCYPGARPILEAMAVEVDTRGWFDCPATACPEDLLLMTLLRDLRTRHLAQPIDAGKTQDLLDRAAAAFGNRWPAVMSLAEQGASSASTADVVAAARAILQLVCTPPKPQPKPTSASGHGQQDPQPGESEKEDGGEGSGSKNSPQGSKQAQAPQRDEDSSNDAKEPSKEGDNSQSEADGAKSGAPTGCGTASLQKTDDSAQASAKSSSSAGSPCDQAAPGASDTAPGSLAGSVVCNPDVGNDTSLDTMLQTIIANQVTKTYGAKEVKEGALLTNNPEQPTEDQRRLARILSTQLEDALFAWTNDQEDADSDRGRFDTTRLSDAYMGERHVFTRELESGTDLDTAVYLMVDRSGSTAPIACGINQALWGMGSALARFEGSHVEFGVWLYDDVPFPAKRVHTRWIRDKGRCTVRSQNCTNWIGSSQPVMQHLAISQRRRKVLFTITDGDLGAPDDFEAVTRTAAELGVELVFLLIDQSVSGLGYSALALRRVSMAPCSSSEGLPALQRAIFKALKSSIQPR